MKRFLGIEQKKQIRETNVWLKNKGVQLSTDMRKSISVEICKSNINKNTKIIKDLSLYLLLTSKKDYAIINICLVIVIKH